MGLPLGEARTPQRADQGLEEGLELLASWGTRRRSRQCDFLVPPLRGHHRAWLRLRWSVSCLDQPNLDPVEVQFVARPLIEPMRGLGMLVSEIRRDPNAGSGIQSCSISEQLRKMAVVAPLELVLDGNQCTGIGFFGKNVAEEGANRCFLAGPTAGSFLWACSGGAGSSRAMA